MSDTINVQDTNTNIAQTQAAPAPIAKESTENIWMSFMPMILIFMVFYFLLIRPQEKKRKEHEQLISGVKRGEEVLTSSGIIGYVSRVNEQDNNIMLQIAPEVEIKVTKASIVDILSRRAGASAKTTDLGEEKTEKAAKANKKTTSKKEKVTKSKT